MSTPAPPPYPGDPQPDGPNDLPSYGSLRPPGDGEGAAPPPPPPGYPPPAPPSAPDGSYGAAEFSPAEAIMWGWRRFTENVGPILLAALLALVVTAVVAIIGSIITALLGGQRPDVDLSSPMGWEEALSTSSSLAELPSDILQTIASLILGAVFAKAALNVADGQPFNLGAAFGTVNYMNALVLGILVGIATTIGFVLCILPGIVVMFLTYLSTYALVDGAGQSPIDAIKTSISLVTSRVGDSLLLALLNFLVIVAGFLALCVGLFAAIPVTVLSTAYAYRWFSGRPVAG